MQNSFSSNSYMQNSFASTAKTFPMIDLGDVILREKCESDVEEFLSYYSDPEVNRFILCHIPQTIEDAKRELYYWRQVFYRGDGIYYAIADNKTNKIIGSIGLTGYNSLHQRIELSYDLARPYWHKGIMSKAILAVAKEGFSRWQINRIEANVAFDNIPSKSLLLKCGFQLEGVLRQHRFHEGKFFDIVLFSLLKSELTGKSDLK